MGIQSAFLGNESSTTITAISSEVSTLRVGSASTSGIIFNASGLESVLRNESLSRIANWVTPTYTAPQWEMQAILVSGDVPTTGLLNTWQALTSTRSCSVVANFTLADPLLLATPVSLIDTRINECPPGISTTNLS